MDKEFKNVAESSKNNIDKRPILKKLFKKIAPRQNGVTKNPENDSKEVAVSKEDNKKLAARMIPWPAGIDPNRTRRYDNGGVNRLKRVENYT